MPIFVSYILILPILEIHGYLNSIHSRIYCISYSSGALSSHNEENDVKNDKKESEEICHFFTTESLLENFRKNCLCDARLLGEHLEKMDEKFLDESAGGNNEKMMQIGADSFDAGGCLIVINMTVHSFNQFISL